MSTLYFHRFAAALLFAACAGWPVTVPAEESTPFRLALPTDNDALFAKDYPKFYMFTMRNFEGEVSYPWTAGQYGFVRDQKRTAEGVILTRFHEGIDISPLRRDAANRPLDGVRSMAPGKVVYTNLTPGQSSYGKYVVIEHRFSEGPLYSLYAHLMTVDVRPGQAVTAATTIGRLGYTGDGIDVARAHVHVELNLLLSKRFQAWHDRHYRTPNHHALYNGLNLAGLDVASLLLQSQQETPPSLERHLTRFPPYYRVAIPNRGPLEILDRYPVLGKNLHLGAGAPSWEIHFSQSGIPVAVVPYSQRVSVPTVTWVDHSDTLHAYKTRGYLTGSGSKAKLTPTGLQYVELVSGQF